MSDDYPPATESKEAVPPDAPLFAEISPLRLAIGVVFAALLVGGVATGLLQASLPEVLALGLLSVVFVAGGFVPFNDTLGYYVAQGAAFLLWGVTSVVVAGASLIPALLGAFGAIGLVVYGRRALSEGLRSYA